jgi:hypothetical protein
VKAKNNRPGDIRPARVFFFAHPMQRQQRCYFAEALAGKGAPANIKPVFIHREQRQWACKKQE